MTDAKRHLTVALKDYPTTRALLDGRLTSPRIDFTFEQIEPIHRAFKPMAQRQAFDVSEMAVFTHLQAIAYGKPIMLLPIVLAARFQHGCIVYNRRFHDTLTPDMLPGKKVGVRAYSQTTGAWVREILAREHGLAIETVRWITFEGGHIDEWSEPDFVTRAPAGTDVLSMLMSGEVDAAILGNDLPDDPDLRPVIPNAKAAGPEQFARDGLAPINHMLAVTQALADEAPDLVREVFDLFVQSKSMAPTGGLDLRPVGFAAVTPPLERVLELAYAQKITPRKITIDEVFAGARKILGNRA